MNAPLTPRHPSIVHALLANAERGTDGPSTIFVPERGTDGEFSWRHDDLALAAGRAAAALADAGVRPGDRVVLSLPTSPEFVTAFFGALLLGAVPTAVATPGGFGSAELFYEKFHRLIGYLEPKAVVATSTVLAAAELPSGMTGLDGTALHQLAGDPDAPTLPPRLPEPSDLAFIQATSGSTGTPKGVQITHANLAANCEQIALAASMGPGDTWVGWLPLHHDMGLIGGFLTPMFRGIDAVLMPPSRFLRSPGDWLRAVSKYGGTFTAAPNFAYGYAAARVTDAELAGVDLSSWRFLFCGAEPIHPPTVQRFVDRFAAWGLPPDALVPCYGMAEASLAVTVARPHVPVAYDSVSRRALTGDGVALDVSAGDVDEMQIVDCGAPVLGTEVRIVDGDGAPCGEDTVGRIQFRGPSTTVGYFRLPDTTASALSDGWWDTGDIGYLRAGRLRITGRQKDLIIIRGANYLPTDFEIAAEQVDGVRLGGVAAVGHADAAGLSEELHLVVETAVAADEHEALRRAVRVAVSKRTGVLPADVHIVPPRSIPKTTSGKVQRAEARRLFVERPARELVDAGGAV
ncbi:Acyl-CoA synthetase (AMP-forming)/AMP-acid ligase II [Nocardia amikacinitolerans]|uniref:fatty acyl-AMP ligase n=1 Tax=Nocardia amikacinitolerans TaxID=756689 RepID=UPI00082ADE3D|nr:fatty acyl-AMP ligase [Nocardia amikacinitolerans]MCP2314927.1 Acyl-CoA synthetase (AMP-forming)/AMP-acid ligase II [Nocardia amikacinitolerans]